MRERSSPSLAADTQELVELLGMPTCFGPARRVVLDHLGNIHQRRFINHWAFVRYAEEKPARPRSEIPAQTAKADRWHLGLGSNTLNQRQAEKGDAGWYDRNECDMFRSGVNPMTTRERLEPLLENLSPERLEQLIDFAKFLAIEDERRDWQEFGRSGLSKAYGPDEPEYTEADIRSNHRS